MTVDPETDQPVPVETGVDAPPTDADAEQTVEESLIEEVSIDGMCGVY